MQILYLAGDEVAKTHNGNNNWYGHYADWTFLHWNFSEAQQNLLRFNSELIKFRKQHPALARAEFVRCVAAVCAEQLWRTLVV